MSTPNVSDILYQGLWKNNPGLVQLLGLCPLLAVSNTFVNALGMGIATTLVLTSSNFVVALARPVLREEIRIAIFVLVIAGFVGMVELIMKSHFYELYLILGIFIPLIVTNCIILGRAEAFAAKNSIGMSILDGIGNGLGYSAVLVAVGTVRELLGAGTLLGITVLPLAADGGVFSPNQLMLLPPSAFFIIGFLIWGLRSWKREQIEAPEYNEVKVRPEQDAEPTGR